MSDPVDALPALPSRESDSHKGDFGAALLIGGARGMAGAVALAGIAALRSGVGRATAATPACSQNVVASFEPSLMTSGLPDNNKGIFAADVAEQLLSLAGAMSATACGTGLGRDAVLTKLTMQLFAELPVPAVFDADALYALAQGVLPNAAAPRILTPHEGEWVRMIDKVAPTRPERESQAHAWAASHNVTLVLKGHRTFVTDGAHTFHNTTGNPGMATAGSGDVLTGVITGLLAQGLSVWDAARLGVYLHGLAGDLALDRQGPVALIASDLLTTLPEAIETHRANG